MPFPVEAYLQQKGAIELLCELDPYGSRFEELLEDIPISRPTLSKRLAQAREASLLEREFETSGRGTTHRHVLTDKGAQLRLLLEDRGVTADYRNYKTAYNRFNERKASTRDYIQSNPPELEQRQGSVGYLAALRERADFSSDSTK